MFDVQCPMLSGQSLNIEHYVTSTGDRIRTGSFLSEVSWWAVLRFAPV